MGSSVVSSFLNILRVHGAMVAETPSMQRLLPGEDVPLQRDER